MCGLQDEELNLGGRVVVVVMGLVVLVPLVPSVHPVVVLRLPRSILLVPPVHLALHLDLPPKGSIPGFIDITHAVGCKGLETSRFRIVTLQRYLKLGLEMAAICRSQGPEAPAQGQSTQEDLVPYWTNHT